MHKALVTGLLIACVCMGGCCRSAMRAFDIRLDVEPNLNAFDIDVVGLTAADEDVRAMTVEEYFGSTRREDLHRHRGAVTKTFPRQGEPQSTVLMTRNDPIWRQWKDAGVMEIFIVVTRLGLPRDREGEYGDSRRRIITVDQCRWPRAVQEITVHAQRSRLDYQPQPNPPK